MQVSTTVPAAYGRAARDAEHCGAPSEAIVVRVRVRVIRCGRVWARCGRVRVRCGRVRVRCG